MFGKKIPLFRLFGFEVGIDFTWFFLAVLITWSLAEGLFAPDSRFAGQLGVESISTAARWALGAAGALGLFASIVLHELAHALVARAHGMEMRGITLFIFGGVAEMTSEPPSARAEFLVAIAGPIMSVLIAGACFAGGVAAPLLGAHPAFPALLLYLGILNAVLVAFNLIPAFPLDGGRVLRSILWYARDNLRWATRITSQIGAWFGIGLVALGVVALIRGNIIGGMWWALIGLFLRGAARMSYQQLLIRRALEGEPVRRFMRSEPVTVPADITIRDLVDDYVYRHYYKMYPVVQNGSLRGCVTLKQIRDVPREQWDSRTTGEIAQECTDENMVEASTDAMQVLGRMSRSGASRLMVVDNGELVGVIALKDLMEFLSARIDLEAD